MGYPDSLCGTVCGVSSGWRYADPFGCHQAEGAVYFEETFIHMFDSVTTIGLLLTLVMIFVCVQLVVAGLVTMIFRV